MALSANGVVNAKVASGGINLSNEVHQGLNDSKSLNALGISDVSTIHALSSSIVPNNGVIEANANTVRFSQSNVKKTLPDIVESMKRDGFSGDPIDVVRMQDGGLTSIDNTRVMAGSLSDTKLQLKVHEFDEPFPASRGPEHFTHKKTKQEPTTYGEAVTNRISRQNPKWKKQNPQGGNFSGIHKDTEPFEP